MVLNWFYEGLWMDFIWSYNGSMKVYMMVFIWFFMVL